MAEITTNAAPSSWGVHFIRGTNVKQLIVQMII